MDLKTQILEYSLGARLEYVVQDDVVVYCGITAIRGTPEEASTTNAAARILEALAKAIGKPVNELKFFELSTHTSWVLRVGVYDFHAVRPHGHRVLLERETAPKNILETFRHRIGGDAMRKYVPVPGEMLGMPTAEV